jgi:hypothetical protein
MRAILACIVAVVALAAADAHERSRSNSVWRETDAGLEGRFYLEARQATLLLALDQEQVSLESAFRQRLIDGLEVSRGGQTCQLETPPAIQLRPDGRLEGRGFWTCESRGDIAITVRVFSPLSANHIHFIRLETAAGLFEQVLSRGRSTAVFGIDTTSPIAHWAGFLWLGFEHILGGRDHVAFVLGLLLLVSGWRRIALVTLGFTLGHSITLALAVLGWVSPPGAAVESLIGFSILFIAGEAALSRPDTARRAAWMGGGALLLLALFSAVFGGALAWPVWVGLATLTMAYFQWLAAGGRADVAAPALSAGFGLVHGVGFAGILLEIDISGDALIPSLLAFNVGVELGQLAIVAMALAVLAGLRITLPRSFLDVGRAGMVAGLAGLGSFWFLGRAFL